MQAKHSIRCLALFGAAVLFPWPGFALPLDELPLGAVRIDATQLSAARQAADAQAQAFQAKDGRLFARVAALCVAPDALNAEATLSLWADGLAEVAALDQSQLAALEALTGCSPRVYLAHPESAGQWWVPAFPLNARARSLLAMERARLDAAQLALAWERGEAAPKNLSGTPEGQAHVVRIAMTGLSDETVATLAKHPATLPAPALVALARRTYTPTLFADLVARASSADLAADLPALVATLPSTQRLPWLQQIAARPDLADVAIATAASTADAPATRAWLDRLLDDPALGAAAALALALRRDLDAWLQMAADPTASAPRRFNAVLALRLRGDAEADLRRLAQNGALPVELAAEVLR